MAIRRKSEPIQEANQDAIQEDQEDSKFIYCSLRKCPHQECLRHSRNIPFDTLVWRRTFKPDKEWSCKDMVTDEGGENTREEVVD